jgi:hypothetical protein
MLHTMSTRSAPPARAVLDTSVIRRLSLPSEAEPVMETLRWLQSHGFSVHLGEPTIVELTNQLWQARIPWTEWTAAKAALVNLIDVEEPILTGGIRLLALEGLLRDPDPRHLSPSRADLRDEQRAAWRRLLGAESAEHISRALPALIGGRQVLAGTASAEADAILGVERETFVADVRDLQGRAAAANVQAIQNDLRVARAGIIQQVDAMGESAPSLSRRLDAKIRYILRKYELSLKPKDAYNPSAKRHRNDAIDAGLLDYLALPAVVCTADAQLIRDVRAAGSWQWRWMLDVRFPEKIAAGPSPDMSWPGS